MTGPDGRRDGARTPEGGEPTEVLSGSATPRDPADAHPAATAVVEELVTPPGEMLPQPPANKPRRSTVVLGVCFVAVLLFYLWVRPGPRDLEEGRFVRDVETGQTVFIPETTTTTTTTTTVPPEETTTTAPTSTTTTAPTSTTGTATTRDDEDDGTTTTSRGGTTTSTSTTARDTATTGPTSPTSATTTAQGE